MQTYVVQTCYRGGGVGWLAAQLALAAPLTLWAGLSYLAGLACDGYHVLLAANYLLVVALHYLVSSGWNNRMGGPLTDACNNNLRAMPDQTVWLLVHYLVLAEVHRRLSRAPLTWHTVAFALAHLVLVPAALLWTHNARPLYALAGAGLGLASAAAYAAVLCGVLFPAWGAAAPHTPCEGRGLYDEDVAVEGCRLPHSM